jgi:diaminopimelate decarboxylase
VRGKTLPGIDAGDYIIIQDTGAYTLSMWSRYNSRQMPKVIGYREGGTEFEILKQREDVRDILQFWS